MMASCTAREAELACLGIENCWRIGLRVEPLGERKPARLVLQEILGACQ